MEANLPENEEDRLAALESYQILDTLPEQSYDDITRLATAICGVPIAIISFVDRHRQWFKSHVNFQRPETPRDQAFCAHAILQPQEIFVVPDALQDERFAANPLVLGDPYIRFYAGMPLVTPDGHALGTLCVIDQKPRQLTPEQEDSLQALARQVMVQLELRQSLKQLEAAAQEQKQAEQRLRHSEERFRSLIQYGSDMIALLSREGIYLYVSPAVTQSLGYQPEDLVGQSAFSFVHPKDLSRVQNRFDLLLGGGGSTACELGTSAQIEARQFRFRAADGQWRWVDSLATNMLDRPGVGAIVVNSRDITDEKQSKDALRMSNERFEILSHATNDAVWDWNLLTDGLWWNQGFETLFGHNRQAVEPGIESWKLRIHPDDLERVSRGIHTAIEQGGEVWSDEYRFLRADGSYATILDRGFIIRETNGHPIRMVGSMQDITERKQAEAQLLFQKTLLEAQIETSLDAILAVSDEGKILSYNQRFVEMWDIPSHIVNEKEDEYLVKASLEKLANPQQFLEKVAYLYQHREERSQEEVLLRDGRILDRYSAPITNSEGTYYGRIWYFRDVTERKQAEAALSSMRDELEIRVSERTQELERASAETRTRARQQEAVAELGRRALTNMDMETLLTGATSLVTETLEVEFGSILELEPGSDRLRVRANRGWPQDLDGGILPTSTQMQEGYVLHADAPVIFTNLPNETRFVPSPRLLEQGINSGVAVVVPGYEAPFGTLAIYTRKHRDFNQEDVHFLLAMSNVLAAAIERHKAESEMRELNAQLSASNERLRIENQERLMALGALREISEGLEKTKNEAEQAREEAERARESAELANRAKSEFLSRMSHELRTPLNAILGFGQIIQMRTNSADTKQQENIQLILKGGHHLLGLINEVLDIARVEAGGAELSMEPVALNDAVAEACALLRPLAEQRGIRLVNDLGELSGQHVLADNQRFKQVLINLLSNGIKYNRPHGEVSVSCSQTPDGRVRLGVRDTGPGIGEADLNKLFTPFERLGAAHSDVEGTGLGLVLSKRLATAMGGTLEVESVVGQGSTFSIELAGASSPEVALKLPENAAPSSILEPALRQYCVLCIEDNASNLRLMEVILESRPEVRLMTAVQGSLGLDLATQHRPDMVLLDVNLPDLNGEVVLRRLKANPQTQHIPVVVLSADATPSQIERLLTAGAKAYLTKPLNVGAFLNLLDKTLHMETQDS